MPHMYPQTPVLLMFDIREQFPVHVVLGMSLILRPEQIVRMYQVTAHAQE
jgi:hypothetical protein